MEGAIWTHRKALLIQVYLGYFVFVTKRGTYIDAFAGPQDGNPDSKTWAAKRVWSHNPGRKCRRLHRFEFFELNQKSHAALKAMLKAVPDDGRTFHLIKGDCNKNLPARLASAPVKGAAFCVLDQRSDECDWATVRTIAEHKADPTKIEIFYFVMAGWLDRYKAALSETNRANKLLKWWGHEDFTPIEKASPDRAAELFAKRFRKELGYKFADAYPIFDNVAASSKGAVKFYMIHASDHDDAPGLMRRAYRKLATGWDPDLRQNEMDFVEGDLKAILSKCKSWDRHLTDDEILVRSRRRSTTKK